MATRIRQTRMEKQAAVEEQARRIVTAVRDLHALCVDAWSETPGEHAIKLATQQLREIMHRGMDRGEETEGWAGGAITQGEGAEAGVRLLETFQTFGS